MRNHPIAGCTENRRALYTIRTSITHSILNIPTHSFSDFVAANAVPPLGSKFFTKPNALMGFSIRTSATWLESKCLTKPKGCFPRTINRDTLRYPGWRCAIDRQSEREASYEERNLSSAAYEEFLRHHKEAAPRKGIPGREAQGNHCVRSPAPLFGFSEYGEEMHSSQILTRRCVFL